MAIEKTTELETGESGNYFALSRIDRITPTADGFSAVLDYALYKDAAAYAGGLVAIRGYRRVLVVVSGTNPTHSDWTDALDTALLVATVDEVKAAPEVLAVEPVPAREGKPEVKAVKARPEVLAVEPVEGGRLEGGKKVP